MEFEACPEKKLNESDWCTIRMNPLISGSLQGRKRWKVDLKNSTEVLQHNKITAIKITTTPRFLAPIFLYNK